MRGGENVPKLIIGGKRYALEKRNLLCEVTLCDPYALIDFKSKKLYLYYPQGKKFVLVTECDITKVREYKTISRKEAFNIMDKYPEGIKERVYIRYFGKPENI